MSTETLFRLRVGHSPVAPSILPTSTYYPARKPEEARRLAKQHARTATIMDVDEFVHAPDDAAHGFWALRQRWYKATGWKVVE